MIGPDMIKSKSAEELCEVAKKGAGMVIDATPFSVVEITMIANSRKGSALLQIENSDKFTKDEILNIIRDSGPDVIFS